MSERDFDGKDLDEALRAASVALGRPSAAFDYELVEGGRKGVFGLGARPVRIRIRDVDPLPQAAIPADVPKAPPPKASPQNGAPKRRAPAPSASPAANASPAASAGDGSAAGTLRLMLELMDFDLEVEEVQGNGALDLVLDGPDKKRLTARGGELLESLEFVLNRMGRRRWPDAPPQRPISSASSSLRSQPQPGAASYFLCSGGTSISTAAPIRSRSVPRMTRVTPKSLRRK
jgi:predicted RNA-binding protein Jag